MKLGVYIVLLILISVAVLGATDNEMNSSLYTTINAYYGGLWHGILLTIDGEITDLGGNPVTSGLVTVKCRQNNITEVTLLEDHPIQATPEGYFQFNSSYFKCDTKCENGDPAWIIVSYAGGTHTSPEQILEDRTRTVYNKLQGTDVLQHYDHTRFSFAVPEFSTATMALAVLGVTLGIAALRKRQ